ncbi:hypothetical protein D3C84_1196960 [compost metagenome]
MGSFVEKCAPGIKTFLGLQIESDARVNASVTEMAVEIGLVTVTGDNGREFTQVGSQQLRFHCRIFPAHHRVWLAWVKPQ